MTLTTLLGIDILPDMGRKLTHDYLTRFPPEMWPELVTTASNNNCSVNDLIVSTMGAMLSTGGSISFTGTYSYAPTTSSTFQAFHTSSPFLLPKEENQE